jgi:hypothetical protein
VGTGGSTAIPTHWVVESRKPRNVFIPARAFSRSVQAGSLLPSDLRHIDPVRSSTIMMSRGRTPQGEQAVDVTLMLNALMPSTPAKNVFVGAFSATTTAL